MNKILIKFTALFLLFFVTLNAEAFSVKRSAYFNKNIFSVDFSNGTSFFGAANAVTGISLQRYIVGSHEITEVVIDVSSNPSQFRIYAMYEIGSDSIGIKQTQFKNLLKLAENYTSMAKDKLGEFVDTDSLVVKEYPTTTHSKTVEYRVSLMDLLKFYKAITTDFSKTSCVTNSEDETITSMSKTSIGGTKYVFE